jgi:hypothetical protein
LANRAFGDAERLCHSLLAAVSFNELLNVHAAEYSRLNFFSLGVLQYPFRLLNLQPLTDTTHPQTGVIMIKSKKAYAAYLGYLKTFNARHPNNEQYRPQVVSEWQMPSTQDAEDIGGAYLLTDGRVTKKAFSGNYCVCHIYPSREAFNNFQEPLSANQYYYC